METYTLIIAIIGAVTGVASLGWNIYTYCQNQAERKEEKAEAERKQLVIEPEPHNYTLKNPKSQLFISVTIKNIGNKDLYIEQQFLIFLNQDIRLPLDGDGLKNVVIEKKTGILKNRTLKAIPTPEMRELLSEHKKDVKLLLIDHEGMEFESRPFKLFI